jgi:CheY-like chemotaxis protein
VILAQRPWHDERYSGCCVDFQPSLQHQTFENLGLSFATEIAHQVVLQELCIDKKVMVFNVRNAAQSNLPKVGPMPSLHAQAHASSVFASNNTSVVSLRRLRALLVSPDLDVRRALVRTLEALTADAIVCSTRAQTEEVLSRQAVEIVFCDEHLPDGSYCDLIRSFGPDGEIPRVVLITRAGEWELYFEATSKGAFDVIRSPWYATDVELAVIRACPEQHRPTSARAAAA